MNLRLDRGGRPPIPHPANRLLGSKTGIIRTLLHYLPDRSDPAVFYSTAIESDVATLSAGDGAGSLEAGGTALDLLGSRLRTLGEAAERYCLFFPDPDGLFDASHADLERSDRSVVPFDSLDVFDHRRLDRVGLGRITPETTLTWQGGTNLLTGERILLPSQLVWIGGDHAQPRWYPTTSNGCACAPTIEGALVGAITERLERDAVMRTWYRQTTPRSVEIDPDGPLGRLVSSRFETADRRIRFLRFRSPVDVPVAGCVALDRRDRAPKFVIGGDADTSVEHALRGALIETAQSWVYLKDLVVRDRDRSLDPEHIYTLEDNLLHYAFPEQFPDVAFLLKGSAVRHDGGSDDREPAAVRLRRLLTALDRAGVTPIGVDLTTRDIRAVGFRVARVVIPELLDLALPSLPPVAHPALADDDLTDKPHPYP